MRTLAVIPARGGSKSIPRKNLVDVAGRPLIAWIIGAAKEARRLDRVIVSTEDEEIAETARRFGADVPFVRPPELATDTVSLIPVVQHALRATDERGFRADVVVSLQPTSPGLRGADIDAAVGKLEETGADSVATVLRIEHEHPYWAKKLEGDRVRPFSAETNEGYLQRQDLPPAWVFDGAIFVRRRRLLEEWTGRDFALGEDVRGLPLSAESSLHIDDEIHLEVARAVLARRGRAGGNA